MDKSVEKFPNRDFEKQLSRLDDAEAIATGRKTRLQVKIENSFFHVLDFKNWKIVAIGGKKI